MKKIKIMVVDDENIIAMDIRNKLKNLGYEVPAMVSSGEEAIQKAEALRPDLILMDIMLKGQMDGVQAADFIYSQFHIPVIYVTAYSDERTLDRAKQTEPFGYLVKPFEERELHTTIQMALYKHQMEEKTKTREQWLTTVLKSIGDAVITTDTQSRVTFMNPVAEVLTGWKNKEAAGKPLPEIFHVISEETRIPVESPATRAFQEGKIIGLPKHTLLIGRDGQEIFIADSAAPVRNEKEDITGMVLVFRDITEPKRTQEALAEQTIRDTLTGLYNRRSFNDRAEEELSRADRNNQTLAIFLCDLDHFKAINNTLGHSAGDELLKAAARSLRDSIRGTDLVFRWGGDEFMVVLSDTDREGALIATERIRKGVSRIRGNVHPGHDLSIGIAMYPEHGRDLTTLIRLADHALYIAKRSGNKVHIGEEEYRLDEHAIKVVFQPVVDVRSDENLGYEALSRDPQGKVSILELFKKYQAVGQLNELKQICFKAQIKAAEAVGLKRLYINVDFEVLRQLKTATKPPGMEVILEISELEALHDIENHLKIADQWRKWGYQFAIDDFGAGFISLPFIAKLLPDYIKVDRSTILQAVASEEFRRFLKDLLQPLQNYAKEGIIAEGIETEKELKIVKDMGIFLIQGFLFGKPQELQPKQAS